MIENVETEVAVCDAISRNQRAIHIGLFFASSVNQRSASFHSASGSELKGQESFKIFLFKPQPV